VCYKAVNFGWETENEIHAARGDMYRGTWLIRNSMHRGTSLIRNRVGDREGDPCGDWGHVFFSSSLLSSLELSDTAIYKP